MTTLREQLIKISAKIISHSRYVAFQTTEVALPHFYLCAPTRPYGRWEISG